MRKLWIALLSSLAIAIPVAVASPSVANEVAKAQEQAPLSYYEGMMAAWKYYANYEPDKALNVLEFVRKNPSVTPAERELLDLMRLTIYRQEGNNLVDSGLPRSFQEKGIRYLTEAIVLDDTNAHTRRRRGQAYCTNGNYTYCKRDYAAAWELIPEKTQSKLASHLSNRGYSFYEAGRKSEGLADIKESIRLYKLLGDESSASFNEGLLNELSRK